MRPDVPLLLDTWKMDPKISPFHTRIKEAFRPDRYRSFRFGEEESTFLGRMCKECGPLIVENREFALPPFAFTYVQVNMRCAFKALGGVPIPGELQDEEEGFLIMSAEGKTQVYTIVSDPEHRDGSAGAYYYINKATSDAMGPFSDPRGKFDKMREIVPKLILGATYNDVSDEESRQIGLEWMAMPQVDLNRIQRNPWDYEIWRHCAGELRILWAALLLINRPSRFVAQGGVARTTGLHKGQRKVYSAHTRIVLNDTRKMPDARSLGLSERGSPRRHEVRGHFVHYDLKEGCVHDWEPMTLGPIKRWRCTACGGRRVWRATFERGDATKGYVTKEYEMGEVTA